MDPIDISIVLVFSITLTTSNRTRGRQLPVPTLNMVKITTLSIAAVATLVAARNCTPNLNYCGLTLMKIGNYEAQVIAALKTWGEKNPDDWRQKNALFKCEGGVNGDIRVISLCLTGWCQDNGEGKSDTCAR